MPVPFKRPLCNPWQSSSVWVLANSFLHTKQFLEHVALFKRIDQVNKCAKVASFLKSCAALRDGIAPEHSEMILRSIS